MNNTKGRKIKNIIWPTSTFTVSDVKSLNGEVSKVTIQNKINLKMAMGEIKEEGRVGTIGRKSIVYSLVAK